MSKYYAVVVGKIPGIYTDWPTTQRMVQGFSGAVYKSFKTRQEAEAFMATSTMTVQQPLHVAPVSNKTIIYTDGSFQGNSCGFGIVILHPDAKYTAYGKVPLPPTNNVAELYAIYCALSLVEGPVILYSDSRYAITSLSTYVHNWIRNGWEGVANRNIIEATYHKMQGRDVILQYVPAHTGVQYNEEADQLADMGRLASEALVVLKDGVRVM